MPRWCGVPRQGLRIAAAWLVAVVFGSCPVFGASPIPWETTVVSPRKSPEARLTTTRAITVLSSEELERWGTVFVGDALRHVPGLSVRRSGGIGRLTNVVSRGSSASHVLVLVDGVKVNAPTTGSFDFGHLTTDNIDRIEILRGGASTLYGSEAVGGLIQIFTKDGADTAGAAGQVTSELGSDRTFREVGHVQWSAGHTRVAGSVSRTDSHGVSADDDYRNITVSQHSAARLTDRVGIETAVRFHHARVGIDDGARLPDPNRRSTERLFIAAATVHHQPSDWWHQQLQLSNNRSELVDLDEANPGTAEGPQEDRFVTELFGAEWRHELTVGEWGDLISGLALESHQGDNGLFDKSLLTWAWFVQPQVTIGRLVLVGGARLFRYNTFGRDAIWEASAAYRLGERGPKIRGGYAQGFHAPTLNDLYFPDFSNPDLKAEESDSYEIGLDHEWLDGLLAVSTSVFHREVDNLIQFSGLTPQNLAQTEQQGLEVEAAARLGHGVSVEGHYTYVSAHEEPSKEELLRVPRQTADISLRYAPLERLAFDLRTSVVGSREDVGREKLKRYSLVDAGATVRVAQDAEVYVRVENLLNRQYEEIIGFPAAGTQVFFGGRVRL